VLRLRNGNLGVSLPRFYGFEEAQKMFPILISRKSLAVEKLSTNDMARELLAAFGSKSSFTTVADMMADPQAMHTVSELPLGNNIVVIPMMDPVDNDNKMVLVTRTPVAYVNHDDRRVQERKASTEKAGLPFRFYQLSLAVDSLSDGLIRCFMRDGMVRDERMAQNSKDISDKRAGFMVAYFEYVDLGVPAKKDVEPVNVEF